VAVGTISNDDPIPSVTITDVSVPEGNTATGSAGFDVTLSAPSGAQADVGWTTVDGTALGGTDYAAGSGIVSFAPGDVTESVVVVVNGDTLDEPDEWLNVVLSGPDGATIADDSGRAMILDDDKTPITLTLSVRKRARRGIASGRLEPAKSGFAVTVSLARRRPNGTYAKLRSSVVGVAGIQQVPRHRRADRPAGHHPRAHSDAPRWRGVEVTVPSPGCRTEVWPCPPALLGSFSMGS
jgi:hypothetical protein